MYSGTLSSDESKCERCDRRVEVRRQLVYTVKSADGARTDVVNVGTEGESKRSWQIRYDVLVYLIG